MFELRCSDLGFDQCEFVTHNGSVHRVEGDMYEHIRDTHPHFIAGLTTEEHDELLLAMKSKIAEHMCSDRAHASV